MYSTRGIEAIASITELRARTGDLVERVRKSRDGVLVQRNNEPLAIIISPERYTEMRAAEERQEPRKKLEIG